MLDFDVYVKYKYFYNIFQTGKSRAQKLNQVFLNSIYCLSQGRKD